jgi:phosphatidylinositol alpha-1,6-mannosyltransferase
MRVLALVTDAFGGHGGIAQYNRDLLSVIATCDEVTEVIVLPRTCVTHPAQVPAGVRQFAPIHEKGAYALAAIGASRANEPIHIVFCGHVFMSPLALLIAKWQNAKLWVQAHGIEAWQELSYAYRCSIEAADLITTVSRHTRRRLLEWVRIAPERVKIVANTVGPQFNPGPKPDYLIDRHKVWGKKVIMTVSRLASSEQYKGHDRVIRSLPRILRVCPDLSYVIVGDGDDLPRLSALAKEHDVEDRVLFIGQAIDSELPDYYRMADVLVMPSTGEGFGIVFLEALASGVPVVGGNRDGTVDPLADGVIGPAINPEDETALVCAITGILRRSVGEAVGDASRFRREAFTRHVRALIASHSLTKSKE